MSATLVVRHKVADYAAWRVVYDELEPLRMQHGCTAKRVMQVTDDSKDLLITHDFPTEGQAAAFAGDPGLKDAMQRGGVTGQPKVEIFTVV